MKILKIFMLLLILSSYYPFFLSQIISVITEVCRRDVCANGECQDRLYLDDAHTVCYKTDYQSFSAPIHLRTYDCTCRTGYAGKRCDVPIDKCSRDQCTKEEVRLFIVYHSVQYVQ